MADRLRAAKGTRSAATGWGGRAAATTLAQWILGRPGLYGVPAAIPGLALGETVYHPPVAVGRMATFCLELAVRTADLSMAEAAGRRTRALDLEERIAGVKGLSTIRSVPQGQPGYLRLPVIAGGGHGGLQDPSKARALGIMPGYPLALPELPALQGRIIEPRPDAPVARRLAEELLTLPTHRFVTREVAERIAVNLRAPRVARAPGLD
jgi:hypothetical protein